MEVPVTSCEYLGESSHNEANIVSILVRNQFNRCFISLLEKCMPKDNSSY